MTKIAVLSDIHGNIDALSAVLAEAGGKGAERLFVCGDITGYYYDTAEVWKILSSWDAVMCHGNHESILSTWIQGSPKQKEDIFMRYGSSYRIAAETMRKEDINSLLSLEHPVSVRVEETNFLLSHGAPWDEDSYLYPDMNQNDREKLLTYAGEYNVVVMGHTHYQFSWSEGNFLALNPGSVGQPRSGKESGLSRQGRAQWAMYDTASGQYSLMTSLYDSSRVLEQAALHDPHLPYLKNVLTRREVAA